MSKPLKCAVVGVGYLGKFHAEKYQALPNSELIAVCDIDRNTCAEVAHRLNVPAVFHYQELLDKVDAVSIAVPTAMHYEVAKAFLTAGVHVLLEKPMTNTLEQARELIDIAQKNNLRLQIGHLERFNAVRLAIEPHLKNPLFIESHRLATYNLRGTDVNVILDLMIHDIDIIQNMLCSEIVSIDAQGASVLSKHIDIANARIQFANHCVANVTASRISFKSERKMRIFQADSYLSADYQAKKFAVFKKGDGEMLPGVPQIEREESVCETSDSLLLQIEAFLEAILQVKRPLVSGEDGYHALETAIRITEEINKNTAKNHEIAVEDPSLG